MDGVVTECPTEETLAAFVDDRLDAAAREEVLDHLADCPDCRDIVLMASEAASEGVTGQDVSVAEPAGDSATVVRPSFSTRRFVPLVAAAAAIVVLLGIPQVRERIVPGDPMGDVADLPRNVPTRATLGRLSIEAQYKSYVDVTRGGGVVGTLEVEQVVLEAKERAKDAPTTANLHALGVASVLHGDASEAVTALEDAVKSAKSPSAALLNDLSVAYFADGKYDLSVVAADRALKIERTPTALWNKAVALQSLVKDPEAIVAYEEFLRLEKDPAWVEEARIAVEKLKEGL